MDKSEGSDRNGGKRIIFLLGVQATVRGPWSTEGLRSAGFNLNCIYVFQFLSKPEIYASLCINDQDDRTNQTSDG